MSAHTPGPWRVRRWGEFDCDIAGPNGEDLGFVNCSDGLDEPTFYPMKANACLIAAAPDLLDAILKSDDANWTPAMRAAIAKATQP